MADEHGARRARQLMVLTAGGGILMVASYLVFVLTPAGQRWDDQGLIGRLGHEHGARTIRDLLNSIDRFSMIVMLAVLIVIALARHRRWLAVASAGGFAGAVVSAELLKRILPRPDLAPEFTELISDKGIDTFPSGHATISTAFVLALVMVSRNTFRPVVALVGVLWCSLIAVSTVTAGWHRPSDAVGGIALATAWMALSGWILARRRGRLAQTGLLDREVPWLVLGALVVGVVSIAITVATGSDAKVPEGISPWAFPLGLITIDVVAVGAVGMFTWLLRDVQFGSATPHEGTGSPTAGSRPAP